MNKQPQGEPWADVSDEVDDKERQQRITLNAFKENRAVSESTCTAAAEAALGNADIVGDADCPDDDFDQCEGLPLDSAALQRPGLQLQLLPNATRMVEFSGFCSRTPSPSPSPRQRHGPDQSTVQAVVCEPAQEDACAKRFLAIVEGELSRLEAAPQGAVLVFPALAPKFRNLLQVACSDARNLHALQNRLLITDEKLETLVSLLPSVSNHPSSTRSLAPCPGLRIRVCSDLSDYISSVQSLRVEAPAFVPSFVPLAPTAGAAEGSEQPFEHEPYHDEWRVGYNADQSMPASSFQSAPASSFQSKLSADAPEFVTYGPETDFDHSNGMVTADAMRGYRTQMSTDVMPFVPRGLESQDYLDYSGHGSAEEHRQSGPSQDSTWSQYNDYGYEYAYDNQCSTEQWSAEGMMSTQQQIHHDWVPHSYANHSGAPPPGFESSASGEARSHQASVIDRAVKGRWRHWGEGVVDDYAKDRRQQWKSEEKWAGSNWKGGGAEERREDTWRQEANTAQWKDSREESNWRRSEHYWKGDQWKKWQWSSKDWGHESKWKYDEWKQAIWSEADQWHETTSGKDKRGHLRQRAADRSPSQTSSVCSDSRTDSVEEGTGPRPPPRRRPQAVIEGANRVGRKGEGREHKDASITSASHSDEPSIGSDALPSQKASGIDRKFFDRMALGHLGGAHRRSRNNE